MRINELRSVIAHCDAETLRTLAVELYRMIPAKVRTERGADELVRRPNSAAELRKARRARKTAPPEPDTALWNAREFLENVRQQNYLAPNRSVPKKERTRWRFTARRVYRDLVALQAFEEHRRESAELLAELFRLLCRAEQVYLFPSVEPFKAMKIPKTEVLGAALAAARATLPADAFLDLALDLFLHSGEDSEPLELIAVVVAEARGPELRDRLAERAAAKCMELAPPRRRGKRSHDGESWELRTARRNLAAMALFARAANAEAERGVEQYETLTTDDDPWYAALLLLDALKHIGLDDLWASTYDRIVERGMQLPDHLAWRRSSLDGTAVAGTAPEGPGVDSI